MPNPRICKRACLVRRSRLPYAALLGAASLLATTAPLRAAAFTLLSHPAGSPNVAVGGNAGIFGMSPDGRFLVFESEATTLVAGGTDTAGTSDVFLFDREGAETELISFAAGLPTTAANGASEPVQLSADGRYVLFATLGTNLVAGTTDGNGGLDLYLRDRDTGLATLVTRSAGSDTTAGNGVVSAASMSPDASVVAFASSATNLVAGITDANGADDLFVWRRSDGVVTLVSSAAGAPTTTANAATVPTFFSADGEFLMVRSSATNLVAGITDGNVAEDALLWNRDAGTLTLISHSGTNGTVTANGESNPLAASADGRFVLYTSSASNLIASGEDFNGGDDVFLWDRTTGDSSLVSRSAISPIAAGNDTAFTYWNNLSADGRYASYLSLATNVVPDQVDGLESADVFLWDRETGETVLVSHQPSSPFTAVDHLTLPCHLSADGDSVFFTSHADVEDVVAGVADPYNLVGKLYLWRRGSEILRLVTPSATAGTPTVANRDSFPIAFSDDGQAMAVDSTATDLVAGLTDSVDTDDVFQWIDPSIFADGFGTGDDDRWSAATP